MFLSRYKEFLGGYFPQIAMMELLDLFCLKAVKLGEVYVVLQMENLDVSVGFLEGQRNNT